MEILLALLVLFFVFEILSCFGMGLIFDKMNLGLKRGIIPFYNKIILINYYKIPKYHLILVFLPIVSIYTNYVIYSKMCEQYNKEFMYALELTFFPFIYNIFLGVELKKSSKTDGIDNYFEDQKNLYGIKEEQKEKIKDEYVWHPKTVYKSKTVYKAMRNNLNSSVNIHLEKNNDIIDNKKNKIKENKDTIVCPKCGSKMSNDTKICYICGNKI